MVTVKCTILGDIVTIVDDGCVQVVVYTYDCGKPLTKTGTLATTLGFSNPFRYRGYVFDDKGNLGIVYGGAAGGGTPSTAINATLKVISVINQHMGGRGSKTTKDYVIIDGFV